MRWQLGTMGLVAWLVLGQGAKAEAQEAVAAGLERLAESPVPPQGPAAAAPDETSPPHEALQPSGARSGPEHIGKAPPALIGERPGSLCPGPDARWIDGYWAWDRDRGDFAWVTGTWVVPPPGEFWVNGYWRRGAKGWYRVPGFWSGGGQVQKVVRVQEVALDGRRPGPPMTRPEEPIGTAPGPDFFYIPGEYVPAWGGVAWRQGYWARSQPGWEWIPARWERRATAWVYREGFWNRVPGTPAPSPGGLTPAHGTTLVSTASGVSTPPADTVSGAAARADADRKADEASQAGQGAGKPTQKGATPKPGDPKPGPQPESAQQPQYVWYGAQPVYPPGRAAWWNARSAVGGFLRRVLP